MVKKSDQSAARGPVIFLVGFMGSGKTTTGRIIAEQMGCDFLDLDGLIESRAGMPVSEIFSRHGEDHFRRLEREAVESLRGLNRAVVALGGGAFTFEENRARIREIGKTVWLDCPLEICLSRLAGDATRPLLRGREEAAELFERRRSHYKQADLALACGAESPAELAGAVIDALKKLGLV